MTSGSSEDFLKDVRDLLKPPHPRLVVITRRDWMMPYYELEQGELISRQQTAQEYSKPLLLWLRQLRLLTIAFDREYDPRRVSDLHEQMAIIVRLDLLGLSGSYSKLSLDALLAGYYGPCLALERHMLETWCKAAYIRRFPERVWSFLPKEYWPDHVQNDRSFPKIHKVLGHLKKCKEIDEHVHKMIKDGFRILSDHAHPTLEGATQVMTGDTPYDRVFGPTFSKEHCERGLWWGLFTNRQLLFELDKIDSQGEEWRQEMADIDGPTQRWLRDFGENPQSRSETI